MIHGIRITLQRCGNEKTAQDPNNTKCGFIEVNRDNLFSLNTTILDKFRSLNAELFNASHKVLKQIEGSVVDRITESLPEVMKSSAVQFGYGIPVYRANLLIEVESDVLPENMIILKWGDGLSTSVGWDGPVNVDTISQNILNLLMTAFASTDEYTESEKQEILNHLMTNYDWENTSIHKTLRDGPLSPYHKVVNRHRVPIEVMNGIGKKSVNHLDVIFRHQIK